MQSAKYQLLTISILLLAFALRVAAISHIPAGLSHDEAYNGIAAIQVLNGDYRIFFEINKGIEPLIIYLEALAFYAFGIGPVQLRLVNIIAGMLTVALIYPFTRRLFNRRVALLVMAGVAISFWAIFVSRLTLRAVLLPPLLLLTLYSFWLALNPINNRGSSSRHPAVTVSFFALSGLCAGITMYTYLSSRFLLFIPLILFAYQLICKRVKREHWLGLLLFLAIWAIIFTPLATYFWQNAESFSRRSDQVTTIPQALDGDFEPMLDNTLRTLGMFTFSGDTTDRYNLDGRPLFNWLNGLLFYLGLALAIWKLIRSPRNAPAQVLLLTTFFFMLLPDLITDDSPHFLRTIGALPVVYIFWAMGLDTVTQAIRRWLEKRQVGNLSPVTASLSLIGVVVLLTAISDGYDYFYRWANAPDARTIYGADIAEVARYLQTTPSDDLAVISAEYYRDLDRFRLDLHSGGSAPFAIWFDGRQSLAFPPPGSGIAPRYIFPNSAPPPTLFADLLQPSPTESGSDYTLYRSPTDATVAELQNSLTPVGANINDDLILAGYRVLNPVKTGGQLQLLLVWQALRTLPPGTDYTFAVQLRDAQGNLWQQIDGNGYDPGDWQPGIIGLQLLTFHLPGDLPPRRYTLTAQLVDRHSGQALPVATGSPDVVLGQIDIQLADSPRDVDPARLPNPQPVGDAWLVLRGYQLDSRTVARGDTLPLTLHWQVVNPPRQNYRLQFTLATSSGDEAYRWPKIDPIGGEWPTSQWPANYWVQDKLTLPVSPEVPSGEFELLLNWVDEAGQPMENTLINLGAVKVE